MAGRPAAIDYTGRTMIFTDGLSTSRNGACHEPENVE
jgi:hypothetical protein